MNYRGGNRRLLFHEQDLRNYIDPYKQEMLEEISSYEKDALLNTPTDELARYFADKYTFPFTELDESEISVSESETKIDISQNSGYMITDRSRPFYTDGTEVTVKVPFTGQRQFLFCNPNQAWMAPAVEGDASNKEIFFTISKLPANLEDFKPDIARRISMIKERLEMMRGDVAGYNASLLSDAQQAIERRKAKLQENSSVVASLGFKMHHRDNAPKTYAVPEVKRIIEPPQPSKAVAATALEPTLPVKEFENILNVIRNMVTVIEQSPKVFVDIDEETLRSHFLVQLNSQYAGQATGETFNGEGKTDIIIKSGVKNLFIAECKFWGGEQVFNSALNQLLGYTTWRDGKLALLIFNRNKDTSAVLKQICHLVEANDHFVSFDGQPNDTEFRFTLSHPTDQEKHITLAVLVFDIPTKLVGEHA